MCCKKLLPCSMLLLILLAFFSGCTSVRWFPAGAYNGHSEIIEVVTEDLGVYHVHDRNVIDIEFSSDSIAFIHNGKTIIALPESEASYYQVRKFDLVKTLLYTFDFIYDWVL